ncbi:hypothetical protein [Kitasatospora sp. NPDC002965]|uniref:hypothetical protein n=1 Tax=Kitasatospora sp. NPDC002965 TaxID=3154775 RepID=UPI0033BDB142
MLGAVALWAGAAIGLNATDAIDRYHPMAVFAVEAAGGFVLFLVTMLFGEWLLSRRSTPHESAGG